MFSDFDGFGLYRQSEVSPEKAALFLMPEKFARKYDVSGVINKYNKGSSESTCKSGRYCG